MHVSPVRSVPAVTGPRSSMVNRHQAALPALSGDSVRLNVPKVSSRPAKDIGAGRIREVMTVPHRYQGDDASCGPSSLWMVLGYHQGKGAVDFKTLDRSLRPTGRFNNSVGTTPTVLAAAARRHGMAATVTNGADTAHLRRLIDHGLPAILLGTWTDGVDSDLHFVVLNGYEGHDDAHTTWHVTDPYVTGDGKATYTTEQLMAFWHCKTGKGVPYPYHRAVVNIAPIEQARDLPADNRKALHKVVDAVMIAGTDVLRVFDNR